MKEILDVLQYNGIFVLEPYHLQVHEDINTFILDIALRVPPFTLGYNELQPLIESLIEEHL